MTLYTLSVVCLIYCVGFTVYTALRAERTRGQDARDSLIEAWMNIFIGFSINYVANLVILPLVPSMGYADISALDNFMMGWIYTAISMLRSYYIRRFMDGKAIAQWIGQQLRRA